MKYTLSKKLLYVAAIFASVSLFAAEEPQEKEFDQGHAICASQMTACYSAPARFDVKGNWDLFVTGSFLYWQAKEDGLYLSLTSYLNPASNPGDLHNMDFDYKPGFKVGVGSNFTHDNWNIYFEYFRLHGTSHESTTKPTNALAMRPEWDSLNANVALVQGSWENKTDMMDLQLARPYYLGTRLTVEPHFGMRGGWLKQNFHVKTHVTLEPDLLARTNCSAHSWLVGPRAGVNSYWHLGQGFRLYGNISGAIFYEHSKTSIKYFADVVHVAGDKHAHNTFSNLTPSIDMGLGLMWGQYMSCRDWHIDLIAGYDFIYFWNQNTIRTLYDDMIQEVVTNPGDFMLSGFTLTARLDF